MKLYNYFKNNMLFLLRSRNPFGRDCLIQAIKVVLLEKWNGREDVGSQSLSGKAEVSVEDGDFRLELVKASRIRAKLFALCRARAMNSSTCSMSYSWMPRVVTASEPMRMPEGFMGEPISMEWRSCSS